jgi:hypothetical protein
MLKEFAVRNNLVWEIVFIRLQVCSASYGVSFWQLCWCFFLQSIALLSFSKFSSPFSQVLLEEAQIFAFNYVHFCLQVENSVQGVNFVWFGLLKHCSQRSCEICSIFGIDMGCVRVRGGAVGGLRLSMERRRLLNAQITATRHR